MADADSPNSKIPSLLTKYDVTNGYDDQFVFAGSSVLRFQERWPPRGLAGVFDLLCARAAHWAEVMPWPEVMRSVVDATLDLGPGNEHEKLQWASAAISMLVHLRIRAGDVSGSSLFNDRRNRTRYGSYPTPPAVAGAIANHLATYLASGSATVVDPTIEGAPLLLECSRVFAGRTVRLIGLDRSPAAIGASARLFEHAQRFAHEYLQPELICADALDTMGALGEIDGLASNPPWGERERNGRERFAGKSDPFVHFVNLALDQLREGGPFGIVLPGQAATAPTAARLRSRLTETCTIDSVTTLPTRCFPRATVRTILILGRKLRPRGAGVTFVRYRVQPLSEATSPPTFETYPQSTLGREGEPWLGCLATERPLRIAGRTVPLGSLAKISSGIVPYRKGRGLPKQTAETIAEKPYTSAEPCAGTVPLMRSRQVFRYRCAPPVEHIRLGEHLAHIGCHIEADSETRVYVRELCGRNGALVASVAPAGTVPRYGIFTIALTGNSLDAHAMAAILNSSSIAQYVSSSCDGVLKESFNRVRIGDLRRLPIPLALVNGPLRKRLVAVSRTIASGGSQDDLFEAIDEIVAQAYEVQS